MLAVLEQKFYHSAAFTLPYSALKLRPPHALQSKRTTQTKNSASDVFVALKHILKNMSYIFPYGR